MFKDVYINVRKLDGGYVLDNNHTETDEGQTRIFTSQQKLLSEIKRILSQDLDAPLNNETN